jgi:cyclopropane-fatty-acyl-phospholipid synthase
MSAEAEAVKDTKEQGEEHGSRAIGWAEKGLVPDGAIRAGIRRLCRQRLEEIRAGDLEASSDAKNAFVAAMNQAEVAPVPELANEQHYEVPAAFFDTVLGKHRKYSSCYWDESTQNLDEAEARSLAISCERAGIEDGMDVLDLGCGWGSLSLWIASHYPNCSVTSVSNSAPQRRFIEAEAKARGLENIRVITADMNDFDIEDRFDRAVSVEMFEHMRNYGELFGRISRWLRPGGQFFMHIFCHRSTPYAFIDNGPGDWMSRHFFSGGIMPSADLPLRFQRDLRLEEQWTWDGRHYEKTANAWLALLDARRAEARAVLAPVYGEAAVQQWIQRWRIFFMACAELFGLNRGQEWMVCHYRFSRQEDR